MRLVGEPGEDESVIPVIIRSATGSNNVTRSFVVALIDAVSSPDTHSKLQGGETDYRGAVRRWRGLVADIRRNRSDPVRRWKLADDIYSFEHLLKVKWGLEATNLVPAIARDIRLSIRALRLILRLRTRFRLNEVRAYGMNWSKFQEVLDIRDDEAMRRCIGLIQQGEVKRDSEIREFKLKANQRL